MSTRIWSVILGVALLLVVLFIARGCPVFESNPTTPTEPTQVEDTQPTTTPEETTTVEELPPTGGMNGYRV